VRGDQDRATFGSQSENQVANVPRAGRIEAGRRLIEQQHAWLMDQGPRERDTLFQSLRELAGDLARPILQIDVRERRIDAPAGSGRPCKRA
jgi:hypothetical protein